MLVVFPFFQASYAIATVINSGNNKEQILFVCCFFILALIIIEVLISINSYTRFNSINLTSACFHYFVCVSSIVEIIFKLLFDYYHPDFIVNWRKANSTFKLFCEVTISFMLVMFFTFTKGRSTLRE